MYSVLNRVYEEQKRIYKLPKWASQLIATLASDIKSLEEDMREMTGSAPTNTTVRNMPNLGDELSLPINAQVRFTTQDGFYVDVQVLTADEIQIMGSTTFDVQPMVSNHVLIKRRADN